VRKPKGTDWGVESIFFWSTINVKENPEFGKGRQQTPHFICSQQGKHTGK